MQRGYAHRHGILTAYIFSEDIAGEENYYSQDAARSRSVKGKYQGQRGQRSRPPCNFICQQEKMPKGIIAGFFFDTYLIGIIMSNMEEHVLIQIFYMVLEFSCKNV